jgi:uncharacterized protein
MTFSHLSRHCAVGVLAILIVGTATGCRKRQTSSVSVEAVPASTLELDQNATSVLPGPVYAAESGSAIHWQPWTRETFDEAKKANRLVMVVIALPQQPSFQEVLDTLSKDAALVEKINRFYMPILVDGDAIREMGLLTADLCAELGRKLQLPVFLWMTPDGSPVAWIPISSRSGENGRNLIRQSDEMVTRMWNEDPGYVLRNSSLDQEARQKRFSQRQQGFSVSERPAEDVVQSIRQLTTLYDSVSRNFDEAGGLFPNGAIDLLGATLINRNVPADLRARSQEMTGYLLEDLLTSAMFDPLDGGVFSSRNGSSWALPIFMRDCPMQARVAAAMFRIYEATANPIALERALAVLKFAEKTYRNPDGLFHFGLRGAPETGLWLWSADEIEKALSPEAARQWMAATGVNRLGNLPMEADSRREYFRKNSLRFTKPIAALAADAGVDEATFSATFDASRETLLKLREARLLDEHVEKSAHAVSTFRMISAYAAAFAATGDTAFRDKAETLLEKARAEFFANDRLKMYASDAPDSTIGGRAFLYALAIHAACDVADITLDSEWNEWAGELARIAASRFISDGLFVETSPDDALMALPISDRSMLFDDSSAGLLSMAEIRLKAAGHPMDEALAKLVTPLPTESTSRPFVHSDAVLASLIRHYSPVVTVGPETSLELKSAVERLPLRLIVRRISTVSEEIPAGAVKVEFPSGESQILQTVDSLHQAVLPPRDSQ